jgi:ribose transport system permease protein
LHKGSNALINNTRDAFDRGNQLSSAEHDSGLGNFDDLETDYMTKKIFRRNWLINQLINNRAASLGILVVLIGIGMSIAYPKTYFTFANLRALLLALSVDGVLAVGMIFLLVSGVFDISIGSNLALGGALTGFILKQFPVVPIPVAVLLGISASVIAGATNGIIVAKGGVNALITTLATLGILRGIAILLTGGGIATLPPSFLLLGQHIIFGLQIPVYYMIGIVGLGAFLLGKTRYFRKYYFIGSNTKAASLSGINVDRCLIVNFTIMGLLAGITGAVLTARLNVAIGTIGAGTELKVITAVIIGGASLSGGRGSVLGAFMGTLFLGMINNIMVIGGINVYFQSIVIGVVLLAAVLLDVTLQRKLQHFI